MAKVIESEMYVAVDPVANNNKFWKWERLDAPMTETNRKSITETGDLRITWGRVGAASPDSQLLNFNQSIVDKKVKEKTSPKKVPQYSKVNVVESTSPPVGLATVGGKVSNEAIKKLAVTEIAGGCAITAALVKKLAETNKHELVAATGGLNKGGMDIDLETGMVRTALGVVTLDTVKEARVVLDRMLPFVTKHDTENMSYTGFLGSYLRLVPQFVGYKKGWHSDFINIAAQNSLLDQLETSVELAEQRMKDALKAPGQPVVKTPSMFECKLALVDDKDVWERIRTEFFATVNRGHSCSHLKPVRVYSVTIPHMIEAFDRDGKKVGNIRELWHGTRVFNILSILKRGFVLPTQLTTAQTTGAMFDNGVYFSAQSTKSLNYSFGYWGGGGTGRDSNCYMFRADVAMGKAYTPRHADNRAASHCKNNGFDSCWAKAGISGVQNDEQIVYRVSQSNIKYLIEFDSK